MDRLEIGILAALWHQILQCFTEQVKLCNQPIKTLTAPFLYLRSEFVQSLRTRFEAEGKKLRECDQYAEEGKWVRK